MIKKSNLVIKHFSPMWFAVSMGIGGFANLVFQIGLNSNFLRITAEILGILNLILFIILIIPWIMRWFMHYDKLSEDLKHPIISNFFVTMPVALMVLATNLLIIGGSYFNVTISMNISFVIWIIGVLLSLIFSVYTMFNMMITESKHPNFTNFSWFISPVATIIVPLLGNGLVKYYFNSNLALAQFINITDIAFYGMGFTLFIILSAIVFNRFLSHQMPHAMVLPSFWIILGPIGVGTISLIGLGNVNVLLGTLHSAQTINFLAIILWGFGLWAFGLILLIMLHYIRKGEIPFSISWWAFIFPLGAYSLATLNIYNYTHVKMILYFAIILTILLTILFVITFIKTILGVFNKKLLYPENK